MKSYNQYCGLALALDRIGDRWILLIVRELLTGPKRYSDLQEGVPGIATNLLASRLQMMQDNELVERRELPPPAASTVYALTKVGKELAGPVHALVRWGGQFMHQRGPEQAFRPHWLTVALQALGLRVEPSAEPLALSVELPEGILPLNVSNAGVEIANALEWEPDVRMRGSASSILGLASGQLAWSTALDVGLEVEGSRSAISALRAALNHRLQEQADARDGASAGGE